MRPYTFQQGEGLVRDNDGAIVIGLMVRRAIRQETITITGSATKMPSTPLARRLSILIINVGSDVVYIGDSSVTTSDGFPLYPRATIRIDIEDSIDVYGITATSCEVRILEGG